jgi:hypothetical protein
MAPTMKGLLRILLLIVLTSIALAIFTEYRDDTLDSKTELLGMPVVSIRQAGAFGWLAMGQAASGVLVIAQAGAGAVAIVQVGAGFFFGVGQLMVSLATIGQLGIGVFGFLGQVGAGAQAIGQGVWRRRSKEYFVELSTELNDILIWSKK